MKKVIVSIVSAFMAIGAVNAQDLGEATEIYNTGVSYISTGDWSNALQSIETALSAAESLGEDGAELAANCKSVLPSLNLNLAKQYAGSEDYDKSIETLNKAISVAEEYGSEGVAAEAKNLIPQILQQKGTKLLSAKDYAGAADALGQALEADPDNGNVALRLGMALTGAGKADEAIAAYEVAAANGQEANANKQISNLYLRKAQQSMNAKNYDNAISEAVKAAEYNSANAQAYYFAGQAAQRAGKNSEAISYFEKYLEVSPDAKNAGAVAFTVGALYQTANNKEKAREYYTKALNDPTYGAEAKKYLDALK